MTPPLSLEKLIGKSLFLTKSLSETLFLYQFCYVSGFSRISATKLSDMIFHRCMCKDRMGDGKVVDFQSSWYMTNKLDIFLPVTVKWESKNYIGDKIYKLILSQWCYTSHRRSGQCTMQTRMNEYRHATCIHASNCVTLHSEQVHVVEIWSIPCGISSKSRRWRWMWRDQKVGLYISKTSWWIPMPLIAGRSAGT